MNLSPDNPTAQKAAYLILTAAALHVPEVGSTSNLLLAVRGRLADTMTAAALFEAADLCTLLVYPRFDWGRDAGW